MCFATDLLNSIKFKNVGQSWPFFIIILERLKTVNFYYNDQKKVTEHKGNLQTYRLWNIKDQTTHFFLVSYGDTGDK